MFSPFNPKAIYLDIIVLSLLMQLAGCATPGRTPPSGLTAAEYRQQAYHSIYEKRYADGTKLLEKAIAIEPRGEDYLLRGDIQEALHQYRAARSSYQKGQATASGDQLNQALIFHWATLEALEFNNSAKAAELALLLPEDSPTALNLQAVQAIETNHFDTALRLTEQITNNTADQEMKGWAYYHAARAWIAVKNKSKAFQSLFFAINHARGHGLVDRITQLWEELKQQPLAP